MATKDCSDTNAKYFNHPFLREDQIEWRDYQINIHRAAIHKNTLIVLPTALGKTMIAVFNAISILQRAPNSKILILAPTRPLVVQHFKTFQKFLRSEIKCSLFSSNLSPIKRTIALNEDQIFFSTPQIVQNDLREKRYTLEGIGLIVFDEAHKARKNYAYTNVAQNYINQCKHPLITGLTASPGKDLDYINILCEKLFIEQIVFRDQNSADVTKYTYPIESIFTRVELPEQITQAQAILESAVRKIQNFMIERGVFPPKNYYSKMDFIRLIQDLKYLQSNMDEFAQVSEDPLRVLNFPLLSNIIDTNSQEIENAHALLFQAINGIYLTHLIEILTTQDVRLFRSYLNKLEEKSASGNKRIQRLLHSAYIEEAKKILTPIIKSPKIPTLLTIIQNEFLDCDHGKIIIFTQYREMASFLIDELNHSDLAGKIKICAKRFVGQASREKDYGLNQKQQQEMIHEFEEGQFNVLVATSVAEEGLDIPNVDAVVFYEAIPSEIRLIQRRGRTGRHKMGRCYFLVSPDTLDQVYHIVSHRKEEKMHDILQNPELVATIPELQRSPELPKHQTKSIDEIKEDFIKAKEEAEQHKLQVIEESINQASKIPVTGAFKLVNDVTSYLTAQSKTRIDLKIQNQNPEKKVRKYYNKAMYEWINITLNLYGKMGQYHDQMCIICDLPALYNAAQEEAIDKKKLDSEISKGIQMKQLVKEKDKLFYFET